MTRCYIALGSNLGDPASQLDAALAAIANLPGTDLIDVSPRYRSLAVGPGEQPDYLNAVAAAETDMQPLPLLDALQAIEAAQGRVRDERWAARTLDLDILLYGNARIDQPRLQVPHPRLQERNFVLVPLADIAPNLTLPCGTSLGSLLAGCSRDGLWPVGNGNP